MLALFAILFGFLFGCEAPTERDWKQEEGYRWAELDPGSGSGPGFRKRSSSATGIEFENQLTDADIKQNQHFMNGSGVAAGDINGDGWPDLYFAQLNGPNHLYENLGGFSFRAVPDSADVPHEDRYSTGVTFADIDGDGDLDLLVGSMSHGTVAYLNDGDGQFSRWDRSPIETGMGTTTFALADIDGDADLDLYVTNYKERSAEDIYARDEIATENIVQRERTDDGVRVSIDPSFSDHFAIVGAEDVRGPAETGEVDALYLNQGGGSFRSVEALEERFRGPEGTPRGLAHDWGLNASFQDLNDDGHPDLYVNNDFWTPDRVWINQGDGVFRAIDPLALRNQSFSSMTVDFADINRDGALDIFATEMLSAQHARRLRQHTPQGPFPADEIESRPQYNRNSLYVNRGDNTYAEVSYYSGLEATEWSWGVRFQDVDLDGYADALVNTGFSHDVQDMDSRREMGRRMSRAPERRFITEYPPLRLRNKAFRNEGDLTFADKSAEWGYATGDDISHGLATADFDKDGDLDLATNRLNAPAGIYENETTAPRIAVQLSGRPPNTNGIGAKITLEGGAGDGAPQRREITAGGEYLSSSTPTVVFAADAENPDHTLSVEWPDGTQRVIDSVRANRIYEIEQPSAPDDSSSANSSSTPSSGKEQPIFEDVSGRLSHQHHENEYDDFRLQPLLPAKLSQQGPGLSWIDYDADGDEDLFIGTGQGGQLAVYENDGTGAFTARDLGTLTDTAAVDQTTILGWPTEAGTQIMIGTSNYEVQNAKRPSARHVLAREEGLTPQKPIPGTWSATGPLAAADYDGDGDVDLFVGGRLIRGQYPWDASSRLFRNAEGTFALDQKNSDTFLNLGLVTGALFTDYDGDGDPDLLLSRAWDSLKLYRNDRGTFRNVTDAVGLAQHTGWWNGVTTGDFTGNGQPDIVATNWGTNTPYQIDTGRPLRMYYGDFNRDRRGEIIEARYDPELNGYVPRRKRSAFESASVPFTSRENSFRSFANSTLRELLKGGAGQSLSVKQINTLQHTLFVNEGGTFSARPLPEEAQFTAAFHAGVADYNADGHEDLFLSQNFFAVRPTFPRLDAGRGLWLKGDGTGGFEPVPGHVSGVTVNGEQRGAAFGDFNNDGRADLAVSQNGAATKLYVNRSEATGLTVRLTGTPLNQAGIGSSVRLLYKNGTAGPRREIRAGGGYYSQRSPEQVLGQSASVEAIEVRWFDGRVDTARVTGDPTRQVISHPQNQQ
jgi:hypothetical protein